jgi:hypothetical protein
MNKTTMTTGLGESSNDGDDWHELVDKGGVADDGRDKYGNV